MKFRSPKEFYEKHGRDAKLWCSLWPPNTYFLLTLEGKKFAIGNCFRDGFDGEEFWIALDGYSPEVYYSLYKKKKPRPK